MLPTDLTVAAVVPRDGRFLGTSAVPVRAIVGMVSAQGRWVALLRLGRGNVARIQTMNISEPMILPPRISGPSHPPSRYSSPRKR